MLAAGEDPLEVALPTLGGERRVLPSNVDILACIPPRSCFITDDDGYVNCMRVPLDIF